MKEMQAQCDKIEIFVVSTNWLIKVNVTGQTVLLLHVLKVAHNWMGQQ